MILNMQYDTPYNLILAVALSRWGVGFVLMDGKDTLADFGLKGTEGDKNANGAAEIKKLIDKYRPDALVIEDVGADDSRRSARIRSLAKRILALAGKANVSAVSIPRSEIRKVFFGDGMRTRDALAAAVADKFPDDLGHLLPPKRELWAGEHYRMAVFEAVTAGLAFFKISMRR